MREAYPRPRLGSRTIAILLCTTFGLLAGCARQFAPSVEQVAWVALEPDTSSHNLAAWQVTETRSLRGAEAMELFAGEAIPGGCVSGPPVPENGPIDPNLTYWYVLLEPRPATPAPVPSEEYSPTAPPNVPEPFLRQAHFLIDKSSGEVVARKIGCVIY